MGRGSLGDSLSARWVEDAGSVADDVSVLLDRSLVEQSCTHSAQVSDVRPIHGHSCLCLVPRVGHGVCIGCALAVGCGLGDKQHVGGDSKTGMGRTGLCRPHEMHADLPCRGQSAALLEEVMELVSAAP